jgi:hypothetical protein
MNVIASRSKVGFGLRSVGLLVVFLTAISLLACVAAIPVVVYYYHTDNNYVVEADVRKDADELWLAVLRVREKREGEGEGRLKILDINHTERVMKATDGVQTGELKVIPVGKRKSRITIIADVPKGEEREREKEQELAAQIMKTLCEEAEAECKLVEE